MVAVYNAEDNSQILQQFLLYSYSYDTDLNLLHSYLGLVNDHQELEQSLDETFFTALLDYMTLYAIKNSIGEYLLNNSNISFSKVITVDFDREEEQFLVIYEVENEK